MHYDAKGSFMPTDSFTIWTSMSDQALAAHIGAFVRHHRLERNRTQDALAAVNGLS